MSRLLSIQYPVRLVKSILRSPMLTRIGTRVLAAPLLLLLVSTGSAQQYSITTVAGFGTYGGDGRPAIAALVDPAAAVVDATGTLYVSDPPNYRIRKIDGSGTITTVIGRGYDAFSGDGGPAAAAAMSRAYGLALDSAGNLYFADADNQRLREVTTDGNVRTVAGNGICGTPASGMAATHAPLCDIDSVAVDGQDRSYFGSNGQVWMVGADGNLVLIAGDGGFGHTGDGGSATSAQIGYPGSIVIDASGDVYIADDYNFVIRKVTAGHISTVATINDVNATGVALALDSSDTLFYVTGTTQAFKLVQGAPVVAATLTAPSTADWVAVDQSGALYVSSYYFTQRLLKVSGGNTTVIAGAYPYDVDALPQQATSVHLHLNPLLIGLAVDAAGNVYFPELDGNLLQRIDKVTPAGMMSRMNTPLKLPTGGDFNVQAVAVSPSGSIYFSTFTQVYRAETNGTVTLIAGAPGFPSALGDGGPATLARISNPSGLAFDQSGNLYITEPFDNRVRVVNSQNIITTFAGTGQAGNTGDNGQATNARVSTPVDVKVDAQGNVYIADLTAAVVRKVNHSTGIITTVAGNGTQGFSGDGGLATQAQLSGAAAIAVDPLGNLFIADQSSAAATISPAHSNNRIRMVNSAGVISTIAGPVRGYNGENVLSTVAAMGGPVALATDAQGNVYVDEPDTQRVRKLSVTPTGSAHPLRNIGSAADGFIVTITPDSLAAAYGNNLATATENVTTLPLPTMVQGTTLALVDSTGKRELAPLLFVSGGASDQVNFLVPSDMASGVATVIVTAQDGTVSEGLTNIAPVSPGMIQLNASGLAAAYVYDATANTFSNVYQVSNGQLVPNPISIPASHQVFLEMFGTGLRAAGTANVSVTVGTTNVDVSYAGAQGTYQGEDQVNVALPASLAGSGDVAVQLMANGIAANPVRVTIR